MMQQYISMSRLGRYGRWGNQLFQFAFLRLYAYQHHLTLQLPPWAGNQILGAVDSPVTVKLPPKNERREPGSSQGIPPAGDELAGHDFHGQAQYHTSYYRPHREVVRSLWRPTDVLQQRMAPAAGRLDSLGRTRVGIHLRRGDYGRFHFYITPVRWYLDWLEEHWHTLDNPVMFIATEEPALVDEFQDYNPQTAGSLGVDLVAEPLPTYPYLPEDLRAAEPHQLDFFPDWYMLTRCDYVLMGNSTFAFTAAMLSHRLQHAFRSDLPTQRFHELDVWDSLPLTHDVVADYPHVPGVSLKKNRYWRSGNLT
jgi:hypothetical protein